jgi:hypothetical protein
MTSFVHNPAFAAELAASPTMQTALSAAAVVIAGEIRRAAPIGQGPDAGHYKRSIRSKGPVVYSTDPFAHLVEWGSVNNPAYAPLRRGVLAAGLRLDPSAI